MAGYKLVSYRSPDGARAGLVIGEAVFDAAKLTGKPAYATVLGILEDWRAAQGVLKKAAASAAKSRHKPVPLSRAKLMAPIRWPSAIYCAGANYADHAAEMARRMNRPPEPDPHTQGLKAWHFIKASHCVAAPNAVIPLPTHAKKIDWEAELGVVIGRAARNVPIERALDVVSKLRKQADGAARAFIELFLEQVWKPFDADGRPEDSTVITREPCGDLQSYLDDRGVKPSPEQVIAVHVLSHESRHLAGMQDEARAECEAVQRDATTARLLGASAADARRLARLYWAVDYARMPDAYRSPDCVPGGRWDEHLPDAPWNR
jgi:hypothetical protein